MENFEELGSENTTFQQGSISGNGGGEPTLKEADRKKLDGIVRKMIQNKESDENIRFVVNDFKKKYGTSQPKGVTTGQNTASQSASVNGGFSSGSSKVRPQSKSGKGLTEKPKTILQKMQEDAMSRPKVGEEVKLKTKVDVKVEQAVKRDEQIWSSNKPIGQKVKASLKPVANQPVKKEKVVTQAEFDKNRYSNFDYEYDNPDFENVAPEELSKTEQYFTNFTETGIDPSDFSRYLKNKTEFFDRDPNYRDNDSEKLRKSFESDSYLQGYVQDRASFLKNKMKYAKTDEEKQKIIVEYNELGQGYVQYKQKYFPDLVKKEEELKNRNENLHKRAKSGQGNALYQIGKTIGSFAEGVYRPIEDIIQAGIENLDEGLGKIGAGKLLDEGVRRGRFARTIRDMENQDGFDTAFGTGKKVKYGKDTYIVTSNGNIVDEDTGSSINSFTDRGTLQQILNKAETSKEHGSFFSGVSLTKQIVGTAGQIISQVAMSRGIGGSAATAGSFAKSGAIVNATMLSTASYNETLSELLKAGVSESDARASAAELSVYMAGVGALTGALSPNPKSAALVGQKFKNEIVKKAVTAYLDEGVSGIKTLVRNVSKELPKVAKEMGLETGQEYVETGAQKILNADINKDLGRNILDESFTQDEMMNIALVASLSSGTTSGAGAVYKGVSGMFGMDMKTQFDAVSEMNDDDFVKSLRVVVNQGAISPERASEMVNEVRNYRNYKNKLAEGVTGRKAIDATQLMAERDDLKRQKKNLDEAFHPELDAKIEEVNNKISKILNGKEEAATSTETGLKEDVTRPEGEGDNQGKTEDEKKVDLETEEGLKQNLDTGKWGMLTGENPDAKQLSPEENAKRNQEAKKWLEERGYSPKEIKGKYDNEENSFYVPNLTREDAIEFAKTFNQESVATNEGLVYQDGSYNPREDGSDVGGNYDNYYSTMNVGGKDVSFQVNYNFDKKINNESNQTKEQSSKETGGNKEGENTGNTTDVQDNDVTEEKTVTVSEKSRGNMTEDGEGNFVFYHYSPVQFDQLDPSKSGSNKSAITSSTETGAWSSAGGVNYLYTRDGQRERMVKGDYGYEFKVPMDKVYDTDADVNNYGEEAERRYAESHNGAKPNANVKTALITQIASENGYQVTVTSWEGTTRAQTNQPLTPSDTLVMNGTKMVKDFTKKYESNYDKKLASEERYDFNTVRDLTNHLQDKYVKSGKMENVVGMQQGAVVKRIMDADIPEAYKKLYVDLLEKEGMTGALNSIPQDTKDRLKQVVIPDNETVEKMSTPDKAIKMINKMLDDLDKFSKGTAGINIAIPVAKAALQTVKAAIKAGKSISQAIQAGTDYVKNSSWYKNLSDSDKAEFDSKGLMRSIEEVQAKQVAETIVKSETVDNKKSTKATVRENTGQTDTSAKVTTTESKLLKEKFKNLQRGFKEGVKETNQFKKEFIEEVENSIKGLKGLLSSETSRILKAVRDINPNNIVVVQNKIDRLVEIIENKEFYRDIKNVKSDVSKLSKSKSKPQNLTNIAKKAGKVNERYLSKKEASEYKDTLDKIKNGLLPVSNPNYKPFNVEEVLNTLERLNDSANTNQILQLAEDYGFADLGLSEKEIIELINSENIDEYVDNLKEAKKKQILDNFRNIAKYSQIGLKEKVFQTELSNGEKKIFKNLREADLSNMSLQQLKDFTTVSDNIIMNEDFSGAGKIDVVVSVKKAGSDIKGRNISVNDITVDVSNKWLIPSWANPAEWTSSYISHITGINVFLNNMFGRKNGGFIYDKSKALDLSDANTVKAQKEKELREAMSNKMDELSEKYPDIRDNKNNARRAVLAVLLQAERGNISDMTRMKEKYIQRSIDNILKSINSEQAFKQVELMRNILTELENIKTKEELIDYLEKNDKGNFEVLKTVRDFFAKNTQALEEIANNYYNQKFDSRSYDDFYLAIMTKSTVPASLKKGDSDNIIGGNFGVDIVNLVKTGSLESRKQYAGLRNDTIINLNFDDSVVSKYAEQVYTIEATPTVMYIKEFFSDPQVISTIGINNRIKLMELMGIKIDADSGNKFGNLKNIDKNVIRMERLVRQAATVWSLGGITQIIKQPMTMMATVVRLGNKAYLLPKAMFSRGDAKEFLKIGSVSLRGDAMGATVRLGDNVNFKNMSLSEKSKIKRLVENIAVGASVTRQKAMEISMKALTYADTYAFESTYIAHYMERLIELGVPESEIDMKTEHLKLDDEVRREARAYALNMANAAQTSTDVSEHSKLTTDQNWTAKVAMSIIMPFSNVSNNSTARLYGAMSRAANTKGEAKEAWNEVIATALGETLSFHAVKNFVVPYLLGTLYNSFYGEEDEEDKDFNWVFQFIKTVSSTFTDLVPYPEFIEAEAVNWLAYKTQKKEMQENGININNYDDFKNYIKYLPFKDTSDDTYSPAYLYKFEEANNYDTGILSKAKDLGIYSVPIDQYKIVSEVYDALFNEKVTRDGKYGKVEYQIAPEHKNFIMVMALIESVNIIAAFDADIRRSFIEKRFREIVRESEKKNIKTDKGSSNSKPKKISDSTWGHY